MAPLALVLAASIAPLAEPAAQPSWQYIGPDGGLVVDVAIAPSDPSVLYVSTDRASVYQSTDGGALWRKTGKGSWCGRSELTVDPSNPSTLYWIDCGGALWRSRDGGKSARKLLDESIYASCWVRSMTIDPSNPSTLYAALDDASRIIRSTDAGTTWRKTRADLTGQDVEVMAVDPKTPAVMYVGTWEDLYKTTDGARTWRKSSHGLPDYVWVTGILIAPSNPDTLYANTHEGVFKSTNAGGHWSRVNQGLPDYGVSVLTIDPGNPEKVYAASWHGLFATTNGGRSWVRMDSLPSQGATGVVVDSQSPNILYAGAASGIFKSTDQGVTWALVNTGIRENTVSVLAVDWADAKTLYAGTAGGLFTSSDGGVTWNAAPAICRDSTDVVDIDIDPSNADILYVCGDSGTYKSTDGGIGWTRMNEWLNLLTIYPLMPTTIYGVRDDELLKSMDGGVSWHGRSEPVEYGLNLDIELDPSVPDTLYVTFHQSACVWKSTDGGGSWGCKLVIHEPSSRGFTWGMTADPARPGTLWAHEPDTARRLWRSTDWGESWSIILGNRRVSHLLVSPLTSDILYVADIDRGVCKSTNGGATWRTISSGLTGTGSRRLHALAASKAAPSTIYAATDAGIFRLEDSR